MKAYFISSQTARSIQSEPAIPQWVSDMGLEWLYLLLSSSSGSSDLNHTARG